jgi:eukaryotic-like serine/threonine-protein kinase
MVTQNQSKVPDGTLLEGKFRVTREIGRGGMAAVYEAENIDIGKRVAVKILAAELITSRIVRERFLREARAAAAVRSPYICDVYDSGMYEERPFLVMELLEGESLYDMLTRVRQLDFETTLRIATHSARGLGKAHDSNIVHRDLKPENIFLTKDEENHLLAKLVDFGLAKFYEQTSGPDQVSVRLTREGALFGTPAYMSPEQAKGKGEVDHRADLWALGCIVYECLTGQTVWSVDQGVAMILAQIASAPLPRPNKLRPDLPPAFEAWFLRALDRDPDKRYQTARELADALAKALVPAAPAARALSLSSDHEGMVVDELIETSDRAPRLDGTRGSAADAQPPTVRAPVEGATAPVSTRAPNGQTAADASSGKAISILMFVALVCLGGYAAWLYVLHPPGKSSAAASGGTKTGASTVGAARAPKSAGKSADAPDSDAYARLLFEAQDLLTNGSAKDALESFKSAFALGSQPPARSMLSQATVVVEEATGPCRVDALARPRPFGITEPSSRPTLIKTERGILYAWVDAHVDPKRRQAHAVLLDNAMRRVSEPIPITPEAVSVRTLQLLNASSGAALLYWDDAGDAAGVYVRRLEADGKIAGPARRVSEAKRGELHPTLTSADGGFWVIWEEDGARGRVDVMARQLDDKLEPKGKVIRLAQMAGVPRNPNTASSPDAVIAQGALQVVFSVDRGAEHHQIMLLREPLADAAYTTGLALDKKKKLSLDVSVGTLAPLSRANSKNTTPRIACLEKSCMVVWDDDSAGAYAAYLERDKTEPLWHREFSPKGIRPTLVATADKMLLAWYEDSRLKLAELGRDGLGKPSVLARVNGFQPEPDITRGEKPGQWLVGFRDYESAHFEAFGLRAVCK